MEKFKNKNDWAFKKTIKEDESYFIDVEGYDGELPLKHGEDFEVEMNFGQIWWEIDWELREYGVKDVSIHLTSMEIELTWLDRYSDEIETKTYTLDDFDECEVLFHIDISDGGSMVIEPTNLLLDFDANKITLDIY